MGALRDPNASSATMWIADADGTNTIKVTNFIVDSSPDWSPDGSQFVFTGEGMVHIVNRDGSGLHSITNPSLAAGNARWSPDGQYIAFAGVNPETGFAALYLIAPDGSGLHMLTEQRQVIDALAWSPSGHQIAYVTGREITTGTPTGDEGAATLNIINADGSDGHEIANNVYPHAEPIWLPSSDGN